MASEAAIEAAEVEILKTALHHHEARNGELGAEVAKLGATIDRLKGMGMRLADAADTESRERIKAEAEVERLTRELAEAKDGIKAVVSVLASDEWGGEYDDLQDVIAALKTTLADPT